MDKLRWIPMSEALPPGGEGVLFAKRVERPGARTMWLYSVGRRDGDDWSSDCGVMYDPPDYWARIESPEDVI